jgi:hypothetical protein
MRGGARRERSPGRVAWRRWRVPRPVDWVGLVTASVCLLGLVAPLGAQMCQEGPGDACAFLRCNGTTCPADPRVRWADTEHVVECGFFAEPERAINCGATPAGCAQLCWGAAAAWNAELPGRFTYVQPAPGESVDFCTAGRDLNDLSNFDRRTSVGGSTTLCDGSAFNPNVLAVALRVTLGSGELIDSDVTVNQGFSFSMNGFRATVGHELGHVLGLDHPDTCGRNFNVLMRSSSLFGSGDPCFVIEPTGDDVAGAERIYQLAGPTPTPTPGVCGDADGNGVVNVIDAANVGRAAVGLPSACDAAPTRCDVDGNGVINVIDAANVGRAAVGLPSVTQCAEAAAAARAR